MLTRRILPTWTKNAAHQERPVVVFIAGQPGSRKTQLTDLVHAVLNRRGGAVRIGADLYKAVHRRYAELLAEDVRSRRCIGLGRWPGVPPVRTVPRSGPCPGRTSPASGQGLRNGPRPPHDPQESTQPLMITQWPNRSQPCSCLDSGAV
ncbi:zeta toxin family protein [Streptomyces sp. NPDC054933]